MGATKSTRSRRRQHRPAKAANTGGPKRRHKYNAQRVCVDGKWFPSKKEAMRYVRLRAMQRAGYISFLKTQVRFPLIVSGHLICTYIADFQYVKAGKLVVEDVKGWKTREYKFKQKLLLALYDITIK